jgi:type IV secretion system protein VirB10
MSEPEARPHLDDSPVIASLQGPPSIVARRDQPWGLALGLLGIACAGAFLFTSLSQGRRPSMPTANRTVAMPMGNGPLLPTLAIATPSPSPMLLPPDTATPPPSAAPAAADPSARLKAPAMIIDIGDDPAAPAAATAASPPGAAAAPRTAGPDAQLSADERFDSRMETASAGTSAATRLRDTALIAPQGTVIPAVTETAIDLELPGYVRAVVSRDVRGFDGTTVLIPRGSQLIGQYRAGVTDGQSRAFVVWSRALTPDGVSVDIGSPAADRLGRSGVPGETNTHFFRRFGDSILLSILSTGLNAAAGSSNGNAASIVIGSQQQASSIASIALQKDINIPDTVTVAQGMPIRVFVARDLDFSSVVRKR